MSDRSTVLLEHHLKELKLPTFLREYGKVVGQCAAEDVDHPGYLLRLSELELIDRHHRMVDRRIKAARFPATKSLDTFDFPAMPSVNKHLVMQLARCEYVDRRENVIAIGNSGTGKTHVALGLGLAACQRRLSVGFTTAASLVHELIAARDERRLLNLQKKLARLNPNLPKVWRYSSGMGDEGQGEAMVRARFRVNGAGVCLQPPRGDLATVWGRWARRDGGERTQQEGLADQGGASLRGVRLAGWRVSCRRAPSGWEWNGS